MREDNKVFTMIGVFLLALACIIAGTAAYFTSPALFKSQVRVGYTTGIGSICVLLIAKQMKELFLRKPIIIISTLGLGLSLILVVAFP